MSRLAPLLLMLAPLLAACGDAPEQPVDVTDRRPERMQPADAEPRDRTAEEEAAPEIVLPDIQTPEIGEVEPSAVYGSWAADEAECTAEGGAPVVISSDRYESPEESCEISELVSGGDGFTASLRCDRGTASEVELLKLTPEDDRLTLSWVARDAAEQELRRCE